ncbi:MULTISPECIES: sigma-70 family RNA polymerase sigma factor [Sphingomonadales]
MEAAVAQDLEISAGLAAVLAEHRQQLVRFFTSRTGDAAEAEDVVQEIWLHVARASGGPVAHPLAYLHRIGMNIALDRLREGRRRARREQGWTDAAVSIAGHEAVDETPSPLAVAEGRQRIRALAAAIEKLPPGAARVFRRHKLDGLGHAEIAAELGISRSAVEKHIAVALRHLREALE